MEIKPRLVIIGAGGRLGAALGREYARDFRVAGFNHAQLDLAEADAIRRTLAGAEFDLLINCAAQTNVDRCETERAEAFALNAEAPRVLAEVCDGGGARLIHISTDYVFDGERAEPYREEDEARPISVYGESKLEGERHVLAASERNFVARVSWVFGPDRPSFIDGIIKNALEKEQVEAVADKTSTPTYTPDIAQMLRALWSQGVPAPADSDVREIGGLFHLTNSGACSWQEYGQWALDCCHAAGVPLRARKVGAIKLADLKNFIARRPVNTVLSTAKYERVTGQTPRSWREAVEDYVRTHVKRRTQV